MYIILFAFFIPSLGSTLTLFVLISIFRKNPSIYSEQQLEDKNKFYATFPLQTITDFKKELNNTRLNFADDINLDKNKIFRGSEHKSSSFDLLYNYNSIKNGSIFYGCIVQANSLLFEKEAPLIQYTAVVIYSEDPYFETNPLELIRTATNLYQNKSNNFLRFETQYIYNALLPPYEITYGRKIYITTTLIDRTHIPQNALSGRILPIIAAPNISPSVFAVDDKYWTVNLVANFMYNNYKL